MPGRTPRCIVLAPTRELANQVEREFAASAPTLGVGCFYGGACLQPCACTERAVTSTCRHGLVSRCAHLVRHYSQRILGACAGADIGAQIRQLRRGVDVAVGTPGRVMDLMNRGALDLGMVKFVILDEADMMLSFGFEEDVETILQARCCYPTEFLPRVVNPMSSWTRPT